MFSRVQHSKETKNRTQHLRCQKLHSDQTPALEALPIYQMSARLIILLTAPLMIFNRAVVCRSTLLIVNHSHRLLSWGQNESGLSRLRYEWLIRRNDTSIRFQQKWNTLHWSVQMYRDTKFSVRNQRQTPNPCHDFRVFSTVNWLVSLAVEPFSLAHTMCTNDM